MEIQPQKKAIEAAKIEREKKRNKESCLPLGRVH
jgi:hypothetical protein